MAQQKWLSVRLSDYERCKTESKGKPWVKVHRDLLRDHAFMRLTPAERFLYIGLLYLAIETQNKIYNDSTHLGQLLYIHHTEIDLKPLYRSGLLITSNLSRVLLEEKREEEKRGEEEREEVKPSRAPRASKLTDEEWVESLKKNPAYSHIDIPAELGKMDAWLSLHPGRKKSRPFVLNWLNKIEKPLKVVPMRPAIMPQPTPSLPKGEECPPEVAEQLSRLMGGIGKGF